MRVIVRSSNQAHWLVSQRGCAHLWLPLTAERLPAARLLQRHALGSEGSSVSVAQHTSLSCRSGRLIEAAHACCTCFALSDCPRHNTAHCLHTRPGHAAAAPRCLCNPAGAHTGRCMRTRMRCGESGTPASARRAAAACPARCHTPPRCPPPSAWRLPRHVAGRRCCRHAVARRTCLCLESASGSWACFTARLHLAACLLQPAMLCAAMSLAAAKACHGQTLLQVRNYPSWTPVFV
jgi:hypothetical protein